MFQDQARIEIFKTQRLILETKLKKGELVSAHVFKMIGFFENMRALDPDISNEMSIDIILNSHYSGYDQFKLNYNMNSMEKPLIEPHGMLKTVEKTFKKENKQDMRMLAQENHSAPDQSVIIFGCCWLHFSKLLSLRIFILFRPVTL
ncbi:uncharacterized protein [Spinacia oleracea]|uniref:Uncharacterized protein n=1 Tax=Spinacia oleracea TaxID=3562 RepID=A0ABM3RQW0_SPIOL|nr:uncharacterized protein LOC110801510 [Spinacia oleracea]